MSEPIVGKPAKRTRTYWEYHECATSKAHFTATPARRITTSGTIS